MQELTRRTFTKQTLGSLVAYSLLETLAAGDAFAGTIRPETVKWLARLNELSHNVKGQKLKQIEWQLQIEELFQKVDLPDLLRLVDFEKLTRNLKLVDNGARSLRFRFPRVEGLPDEYVFGKQIFALKKGRSVVPHGHNNMATAFLVLKGELRGRHYDRLEDADDYFLIRPTIDRNFAPGECSTVSDYKDNVHWFQALSEPAYIFNIHVLNIRPGSRLPTGRVYLNPDGEKLKDNLIKAPRIGYKQSLKMFG